VVPGQANAQPRQQVVSLPKQTLPESQLGRGRFESFDVGLTLRNAPFTLGIADNLLEIGLSAPRKYVRAITRRIRHAKSSLRSR